MVSFSIKTSKLYFSILIFFHSKILINNWSLMSGSITVSSSVSGQNVGKLFTGREILMLHKKLKHFLANANIFQQNQVEKYYVPMLLETVNI